MTSDGTMRRSPPCLTLIVTGVDDSLSRAFARSESRWPALALLASRGALHSIDPLASEEAALRSWQLAAVRALSPAHGDASCCASAPLTRAGQTQEPPNPAESWWHLECVHFAAGLNDVAGAELGGDAALSEEERTQLAAMLSEHLRTAGFELVSGPADGWLLRSEPSLRASTIAPEHAFRSTLAAALPSGENAGELRRLMTELQMLLHEHAVNARRARRGLPAANAVWIWGGGAVRYAPANRAALPIAFGDEPYLRGLYLLHDSTVHPEPRTVGALLDPLREGRSTLAVIRAAELDVLEAHWLRPLLSALQRGAIRRMKLHLGRWSIEINRRDALRFWRRSLPPHRWCA